MASLEADGLLREAAGLYSAGRYSSALELVTRLLAVQPRHPVALHLKGLVEKSLGNRDSARRSLVAAHQAQPSNPEVANNLGNLLGDLGEIDAALAAYAAALASSPQFHEARLNRAITLHQLGRFREVREDLDALLPFATESARFWAARGSLEQAEGNLAVAAECFDRAIALAPADATALHGRARIALERGESAGPSLFAAARKVRPDDPEILLGDIEAAETVEPGTGRARLEKLLETNAGWAAGQKLLARLRWESGVSEHFASGFAEALDRDPANIDLWREYSMALAAVDRFEEAADAASRAARLTERPEFYLAEATYAGQAGDGKRAEAALAEVPPDIPGFLAVSARNRLRRGEADLAAKQLEELVGREAGNVDGWALLGVAWRLTNDPRTAWLMEQPGFVFAADLGLTGSEIHSIAACIRKLHHAQAFAMGQSMRGGTQTVGNLLDRLESPIALLRQAIVPVVDQFWASLPPADEAHPLLGHRAARPHITGSWSVRLMDQGFHIPHIHPAGLVSSAVHLCLPEADPHEELSGWLELGRPPADLEVDLEPTATIEPRPGRLILFPSFLYHGTRPFSRGERLSVAFDISAGQGRAEAG